MIKKGRIWQDIGRISFSDILPRKRICNIELERWQDIAGCFYYLRVRALPLTRIYISIGENILPYPARGRFSSLSDDLRSGCGGRISPENGAGYPADFLPYPAGRLVTGGAGPGALRRSRRPAIQSFRLPRENLNTTEVCHVQDPLGAGWSGDPDRARGDRRLVDTQRLGDAAVVVAGARGAAVSALAGGVLGGKKPGRLHNGWAAPSKPPGQRGGAKPSVALRFAPFEAARLGRDRGEVPRAVCAISRSVALGMPQSRLTTSVAGAASRCKPLTPSQGGDRATLAASGAGADARAAWGQPGGNAGQHGDRPCPCQKRVTSVPTSEAACNMCQQGESTSLSGVRVTFRLGSERDSQRDNVRLVNITPGRAAIV